MLTRQKIEHNERKTFTEVILINGKYISAMFIVYFMSCVFKESFDLINGSYAIGNIEKFYYFSFFFNFILCWPENLNGNMVSDDS